MTEKLTTFMPAGGLGSRLRPHTNNTPKPMLLMGSSDKRIIDHPLELCVKHSDSVLISVDYLAEDVEDYLDGKPKLHTVRDKGTIGSGGSLLCHYKNLMALDRDGDLLILPSDHIYDGDFDLEAYWAHHKASGADITLMTVPTKSYGEYLHVTGDQALCIEKSPSPHSVSTTGTYMFRNDFILNLLRTLQRNSDKELNIYKDIVCPSVGKAVVGSFFISSDRGFWEDTGTLERYLQSNMRLSGNRNVISPEANIDESVRLRQCVVLGKASLTGNIYVDNAIISATDTGELRISHVGVSQTV